ncbi:hypothetical protein Y032_0034g2917 [Ancylostoma ceylanicum]|uniref:Cytosolic fatty-acid binding proteins domain-containing protein n=1 Tax=Ancylostoma ceylanicum TaxID=53326 RepID=A0A016UN57_9BILA|nr:hypothetical protein Y032_0034g2917 [Ancylostoma ceylanicum]
MPVEQDILGKWTFVSSENFEAYLKERINAVRSRLSLSGRLPLDNGSWSAPSPLLAVSRQDTTLAPINEHTDG